MNDIYILVVLAVLGLMFGSFAGAMVWRLRSSQLREDKELGEKVLKSELAEVKNLKKTKTINDRSVCLHCGHTLAWYDLVPLVSWVLLWGKCRYCRTFIGWTEPLIELSVAAFFVVSYLMWPTDITSPAVYLQFFCWLAGGVGLAILFVYDSKWFLLPDKVMFPLFAISGLYALLSIMAATNHLDKLTSIFASVCILSGLYYALYVFSQHRWVGFGDVKLGLVLALFLADWQLAFLALFLANLIGTLVLLPSMARGKLKRGMHVPFGPFLIAGWVVAGIFGLHIISWYLDFTLAVA